MECEKVMRRLSAYLDGELNTLLSQDIARHLRHCPACRNELEGFMNTDALLNNLPRHVLSPDFLESLVSKVQMISRPEDKAHPKHRILAWLVEFSERFLDLFDPMKSPKTRTLEEFNDIPVCFIGHVYFKILD